MAEIHCLNRADAAEQAFACYDMGDLEIVHAGLWVQCGDDEVHRPFVATDDLCGKPRTLTFVVRFQPDSAEVKEAFIR